MRPLHTLRRGLAAALLASLGGAASAALTPGTVITGLQDGQATLLGNDSGFVAGPNSNVTALSNIDLEFLSGDAVIGIDFFESGLVQLYDNGGAGLAGSTVLRFDFAGLLAPLVAVSADLSTLLGGSVSAELIDADTLQITLTDLNLGDQFVPLSLQLRAQAQELPEPAPWALLALAALGAALTRRPARPRA
jgi:hypothetical protein